MKVLGRGVLLLFLFVFSSRGVAGIFGEDGRASISKGSQAEALARSTAVAVLSANYSLHDGKVALDLGSTKDFLCADEKFYGEPSLSYACSGFLVGPDLIVTAGHCMVNFGESRAEKESYCKAFSWIFDYKDGADYSNLPAENFYNCAEIIYAVNEEQSPSRDFAVVRLDRPVTGRQPLKLAALAPHDEPLSMIGYPYGLPAKLASGARVLSNDDKDPFFTTNLDATEGNSGSAVFNAKGEVVGILVGGTPQESLIRDEKNSCMRYNHCDDDGKNCQLPDQNSTKPASSQVQRIEAVIPWMNSSSFTQWASSLR